MADSQSNARLRADAGAPRSGVIHVRTRLTADFTVVANALAQRRGSAVTVGVAVYILSLPSGSPVTIAALCAHFTEGEILISRALRSWRPPGTWSAAASGCRRGRSVRGRTSTTCPGAPRSRTRSRSRTVRRTRPALVSSPQPTRPRRGTVGGAHGSGPAGDLRPGVSPPRRSTPGAVRTGGRAAGARRHRVAGGRCHTRPDHQNADDRAPRPLPDPPGGPPRVPPPRDPTARAATPEPVARPVVPPLQTCDGCDRAFRAPQPGRCRDCRPAGTMFPAAA